VSGSLQAADIATPSYTSDDRGHPGPIAYEVGSAEFALAIYSCRQGRRQD
jgi:hypothetical protein